MLRGQVALLADIFADVVEFERPAGGHVFAGQGVHHDVNQFPIAHDDGGEEIHFALVLPFPLVGIVEKERALRVDARRFSRKQLYQALAVHFL